MTKSTSLVDRLIALLDYLCIALLMLMLLSTGYQVFARYVLNDPPFWSAELSRYLLVWLTMLGSAALMKEQGGHITVEYLLDRLSPKLLFACLFARDLLTLVMCSALVYYGITFVEFGARTSSSGLGVPMNYPYMAIPVGAVLIAVVLLMARIEERTAKCKVAKELQYGH